MSISRILLQCVMAVALVWWTGHCVPDREWRALEVLKFKRDEPRPAWHEVETRFRELSHWYLETAAQRPQHIRAQRRAARAFKALRGMYAAELDLEERLGAWLSDWWRRQRPGRSGRRRSRG